MAKRNKRRTYSRKKYYRRNRATSGLTEMLFGIIVILVLISSLASGPVLDGVAGVIGVATPVIFMVAGLILLGVVCFVGWKVYGFIQTIRKVQQKKKKIDHQFAMTTAKRSFRELNWRQFEEYVGYVFRQQGYRVEVTQARQDKGIDAILYKDGQTIIVQAKFFKEGNNVGGPAVQQFAGTMLGYDAGIFVTTSDYTSAAREYAQDINRLTLIDGAGFHKMIESLPIVI